MKTIQYPLMLTLLLVSTQSPAQTTPNEICPFQEESISNAPGEGNIADLPYFKHLDGLTLEIPEAVRTANSKFFNLVPQNCLGKGLIVDTRTKKVFYYYNTIESHCDGGNTFGVVVGEESPHAVADIDDGVIVCRR